MSSSCFFPRISDLKEQLTPKKENYVTVLSDHLFSEIIKLLE